MNPHLSRVPVQPPLPHNHAWYDASGRRVRKTGGGSSVDYLYDLGDRQITELSSTGTWNRGEVYAGGKHVATYRDSTTYFIHSDWLNTERVRTTVSAGIYQSCSSLPFGDALSCSGSDPSPLHFTGKQRDTETNLDYFGARYFASSMGRWTTPDWASKPISVPYAQFAVPQTLNLYNYVGNNPLLHFDPDGHCWPVSACADIVIAKVSQAQQYIQNKAVNTGSPTLAAAATFTSGVAKDLINGVASLGKVGQATGTCMGGNGCTGGQWAKAVGGDVLKAAAIAGGVAGVAAKAGAAVEALTAGSRAGSAAEAGTETTALFRAVKPAELQDLQATGGQFRVPPGMTEGKYFSTSAEGAQRYGEMAQAAYGDGPYTVVSTSIPTDLITPEMQTSVDFGIQTIVVPTEQLGELEGMAIINPGG